MLISSRDTPIKVLGKCNDLIATQILMYITKGDHDIELFYCEQNYGLIVEGIEYRTCF